MQFERIQERSESVSSFLRDQGFEKQYGGDVVVFTQGNPSVEYERFIPVEWYEIMNADARPELEYLVDMKWTRPDSEYWVVMDLLDDDVISVYIAENAYDYLNNRYQLWRCKKWDSFDAFVVEFIEWYTQVCSRLAAENFSNRDDTKEQIQ